MPRGGKRPGAGAPKGNFNGVRSGNHSSRMLMVYLAIVNHPGHRALARDLYEHGFFPPPRKCFNNDVRGLVSYLWHKWFDCIGAAQSTAIKSNQPSALQPALPASNPPPQAAEKEKVTKRNPQSNQPAEGHASGTGGALQ